MLIVIGKLKIQPKYLPKTELDRLANGLHQGIILDVADFSYTDYHDFISDEKNLYLIMEDKDNLKKVVKNISRLSFLYQSFSKYKFSLEDCYNLLKFNFDKIKYDETHKIGFKNILKEKIRGIINFQDKNLPYEEKGEIADFALKNDVDIISLIAPTSNQRIEMIAGDASGFIYLVSSFGVTGIRSEIKTDLEPIVSQIKKVCDLPVAVGFGIHTPKQAKEISKISDRVIVGSAIVNIIAEHGENASDALKEYVSDMKNACS